MDIKRMIESHQDMIDAMAASLKDRGFDKALLRRPVELHEERAAGVKARIEALETARRDYVLRVDGDIESLKNELSTIEARIKTERKQLASVMKPTGEKSPAERPPSGARASSGKRPTKVTPRATTKRPAKPRVVKATAKRHMSKKGRDA